MQSDAHQRAKELLGRHKGETLAVHGLGVADSLINLLILTIIGLIAAVIISSGEARYPTAQLDELPEWARATASGVDSADTLFDDTGLLPIVTGNLHSRNFLHRIGADLILSILRIVPSLRNSLGALTTLLALGLGLLLLHNLVTQIRRSLIADLAGNVATLLRRQIHRQMYRLGQSSLPTEGTGPVINLITREVNDVRDALFMELDRRWKSPVFVAGLILYALALSPILSIFLTSLCILTWLAARRADSAAREAADVAVRDAAVNLAMLHEDIGMLRTVRVFGMEKVDNSRFDEHMDRFRDAEIARMRTESRLNPTTWLIYGVATAVAVGLLGFSVLKSRQIEPASAILLVMVLGALVWPTLGWLAMRKSLRQSSRSATGIFEFIDRKPELHQQGGALFLAPMSEKIRFKNLTLKSRSGDLLLDDLNIEIPANSKTAVMSFNEDTKHALVCLIPRLIDPTSGSVSIDGKDLREVTLESIRAQVAIVLQADLCFTDSVIMNIGLGDAAYDMPRIIEAAKVAHAHHFIQDLPEGYDTLIGPLGHYLSLDQQYRIALARAYLHDPSIVIIEEPDLTLDDDTKHLIDDSVARLSRNRTVIVLPHRLSTIRSCDQIVLLHNGKVDMTGPPRKLETESKLFRHMQYLEFNPFANTDLEAAPV